MARCPEPGGPRCIMRCVASTPEEHTKRQNLARQVSVIAIDGPVAAGKTAVGRGLAQRMGFACLDTGIMYRAITWLALHSGVPVEDESSLGELARANPVELVGDEGGRVSVAGHSLGPELRGSDVDSNVSAVSKASPVRQELVAQQRRIAGQGRIVMIGRDIGTVVLPDADLKVYLTASAENRARRRWQEMRDRGEDVALATVLSQTLARDKTDTNREDSPLKPAHDAWTLDTGGLDIEQVVRKIIERCEGR